MIRIRPVLARGVMVLLLAGALAGWALPRSAPTAASGPQSVPVLLYHHLRPEPDESDGGATVSVAAFTAQMEWLAANGYTAITVEQLSRWLRGRETLPPRPVLITFDDGYRSGLTYALPVLQPYGLKASIFVITSLAGHENGHRSHLTWDEMRQMEATGLIEFQGHTHDGHRQADGVPVLRRWSAAEIRTDLAAQDRSLMANLFPRPIALAYPYGAFDAEVLDAVRGAGLALGFTVQPGHVRRGMNPLILPRQIVYPGLTTEAFVELVTGGPGQ